MKHITLDLPVDCLLSLNDDILAGCYEHEENKRNGKIYTLSQNLEIKNYINTTGTLDLKLLKENKNIIFSCNSNDITILDENLKIIKCLETNYINTYISIKNNTKDRMVSTDTNGTLALYDNNLNKIYNKKITDDILWTALIDDIIYTGGDYLYTMDGKNMVNKIDIKNVTAIEKYDNELIVGTYDNLYKLDIRNYKIIEDYNSYNKEDNINNYSIKEKIDICTWRIKKYNDNFIIASMYEGIKILKDKNIIKEFKTDSIAYGIEIKDKKLYFSSFYDKKLYLTEL